ncbi:MAG TPA: L-seryl-tRNA(Sec) selenium transferase [Fimbriimonadales bacterium]|nr:L-seryl-tRNA(Sec) selenium transferase [Fimbriimonadales bacterium]
MNELFRGLPSVATLLDSEEMSKYPHTLALEACRKAIDEAREIAQASKKLPDPQSIFSRAVQIAQEMAVPYFRPVINCTGTILNTGLGRARLAKPVAEAIAKVALSHSTLEIDLESGRRGNRQTSLRKLLCRLTGAESALVVNNNAAAVMLAVNTFANGKKVLLSRGQSVEIGGSFRMPDVVRSAGGILVDVGCTNKTKVSDYEEATDSETKVLLRCHPSNFTISGFVEEPSIAELAEVASLHGLVLIDDVGSGCLIETTRYGLPHEPTIRDSLKSGSHIVTASGDKLLGGPQAGIILGKMELVDKIARNPLVRAVRIDKLTATGLEATLRLYEEGKEEEIPVIRYIARSNDEVRSLAQELKEQLNKRNIESEVTPAECEVGGGSLPGVRLPSFRVSFKKNAQEFAKALRKGDPPVIGYIAEDTFHLDMRTVEKEEIPLIASCIERVSESLK